MSKTDITKVKTEETIEVEAPKCPMGVKIQAYRLNDKGWGIEPASSSRDWMAQTKGHSQKCLPLLAANQMGYVMRNPTEVTAIWNGGDSHTDTKVIHEDGEYTASSSSHFGCGIITFQIPFIFRTPPGIGLFVRGATNFWIENACPLDGFVETHWSPYTFTMNWRIVKPDVPVVWKKGDPVCMVIPYPVELLENIVPVATPIESEEELNLIYQGWSDTRDRFNGTDHSRNDWQKDYFLGKKCPFAHGADNIASPHRTKFKLPPFKFK